MDNCKINYNSFAIVGIFFYFIEPTLILLLNLQFHYPMSKHSVSLLSLALAVFMFGCQQQAILPDDVLPAFQGELMTNVDIEAANDAQQPIGWDAIRMPNVLHQLYRHAHTNNNHSLAAILSDESQASATWVQTLEVPVLATGTLLNFNADILTADFTGSVTITWEGAADMSSLDTHNSSNTTGGCSSGNCGNEPTSSQEQTVSVTRFRNQLTLSAAQLASGDFQTFAMNQLIEQKERGTRNMRVFLRVDLGSTGTVYFDNISVVASTDGVSTTAVR